MEKGNIDSLILKKRWLNPDELEVLFKIGKSLQSKMRMNKSIPYSKLGGLVRYDRHKIDEMFEDARIT